MERTFRFRIKKILGKRETVTTAMKQAKRESWVIFGMIRKDFSDNQ